MESDTGDGTGRRDAGRILVYRIMARSNIRKNKFR